MTDEPEWRQDRIFSTRVREQMRLGYGVEDIAARLKVPVAEVRREADLLRRLGTLDDLYRGRR